MKIKRMLTIILLVFTILPTVLVASICAANFHRDSMAMVWDSIRTTADVQAKTIDKFFRQRTVNLRVLSRLPSTVALLAGRNLGAQADLLPSFKQTLEDILRIRVEEQFYLDAVVLLDKGGAIVASSGVDKEQAGQFVLEPEFLERLIVGEQVITSVTSASDGETSFFIYHPVMENGVYTGCLCFIMNTSYFDALVTDAGFFQTGNVTVMDRDGLIVASGNPLLDGVRNLLELPGDTGISALLRKVDFARTPSGNLTYYIAGEKRLAFYAPVPGSDWVVISAADAKEFTTPIKKTLTMVALLTAFVVAIALFFCWLVVQLFSQPMDTLMETIHRMQDRDYSILPKFKGHSEFAEIGRAFNELMSRVSAENQKIHMEEERYRIVSEQADIIIFEMDLQDRTVYHSPNFAQKFGYEPCKDGFPESVIKRGRIHQEDLTAYRRFFDQVCDGEPNCSVETRIQRIDGVYLWCKMQTTTIFDKTGRPIRAIGRIEDIDAEKRATEQLLDRAQRDAMTSLYNKYTAESLIQEYIENSGAGDIHALFVVDVDNFKLINDTLGHLSGDHVLADIAKRISSVFRSSDIVGRVGGDEFVVFMRNCATMEIIQKRAEELTEVFRSAHPPGGKNFRISGSIGIAVYPKNGRHFKELFENADRALYAAKHKGKDCYEMFQNGRTEDHYVVEMESDDPRLSAALVPEKLTERIFYILYNSKDVPKAVSEILDLVGRRFEVSRAYIVECTQDAACSQHSIYEWCREGIKPQRKLMEALTCTDLQTYQRLFNEQGIFYCNDVTTLSPELHEFLKPQQIHSMLQCAILDDGRFQGIVGYDECEEYRLWTKEEVYTLSFIAKLLSTFLIKTNVQNRLRQSFQHTRDVLDTQEVCSYVVDAQTHELLFLNAKTKELAPEAILGCRCHEVLWGNDQPCSFCPMLQVGRDSRSHTRELYNAYLHIWTSITASHMDWDGARRVCLITCVDISRLKEPQGEDQTDG